MTFLTPDNLFLSEVKNSSNCDTDIRAINCTRRSGLLPKQIADLVHDSVADNTRRAYASDLAGFEAWGGTLPASDLMIAQFVADHASTHAPATLARWLVALGKAHRAAGYPDPARTELVQATLRGVQRNSAWQVGQAKPLLRDDLFAALDVMTDRSKDVRDRTLLLTGFAGGFRRSELVGLNHSDVEHVRQGIVIHLRRSKTDQAGMGRQIGIPHGRTRHCPVTALDKLLERSPATAGPIFRQVNRHGQMLDRRLSGEAVSIIVKERIRAAMIEPDGYSGHSLRAGFATSAAQAGISSWKIRQQTGHASDAMLSRYIRAGELFIDNAAGALL